MNREDPIIDELDLIDILLGLKLSFFLIFDFRRNDFFLLLRNQRALSSHLRTLLLSKSCPVDLKILRLLVIFILWRVKIAAGVGVKLILHLIGFSEERVSLLKLKSTLLLFAQVFLIKGTVELDDHVALFLAGSHLKWWRMINSKWLASTVGIQSLFRVRIALLKISHRFFCQGKILEWRGLKWTLTWRSQPYPFVEIIWKTEI